MAIGCTRTTRRSADDVGAATNVGRKVDRHQIRARSSSASQADPGPCLARWRTVRVACACRARASMRTCEPRSLTPRAAMRGRSRAGGDGQESGAASRRAHVRAWPSLPVAEPSGGGRDGVREPCLGRANGGMPASAPSPPERGFHLQVANRTWTFHYCRNELARRAASLEKHR